MIKSQLLDFFVYFFVAIVLLGICLFMAYIGHVEGTVLEDNYSVSYTKYLIFEKVN